MSVKIFSHAVGVRRLEHPFLDRLHDHHGTGERDERHARGFGERDRGHRLAGGRAADQRVDLVLLDQALDVGAGLLGVARRVIGVELDLAAEQAAGGVHLFHVEL
jgi:hypothetical protein